MYFMFCTYVPLFDVFIFLFTVYICISFLSLRRLSSTDEMIYTFLVHGPDYEEETRKLSILTIDLFSLYERRE